MSRKKEIPIRSATAAQLKRLGLKKKTMILPIDVAHSLEAQAETEERTEAQIVADAFRSYQKEFKVDIL